MFAKENERGGERSEAAAINLGHDIRYRYIRAVFCLGLSVCRVIRKFPHCFNMRALFSLIVNQSRPQSASARDGQEYARSQKRKHWFRE